MTEDKHTDVKEKTRVLVLDAWCPSCVEAHRLDYDEETNSYWTPKCSMVVVFR